MAIPLAAQREADPADVSTLDDIIQAFYEVVSGPAGESADRERDFTLHVDGALVGIPSVDGEGNATLNLMTLADYPRRRGWPAGPAVLRTRDPPGGVAIRKRRPRIQHVCVGSHARRRTVHQGDQQHPTHLGRRPLVDRKLDVRSGAIGTRGSRRVPTRPLTGRTRSVRFATMDHAAVTKAKKTKPGCARASSCTGVGLRLRT